MKLNTIATAILASMIASSCANSTNPVIETLQKAVESGAVLYGHQDDLMYGHSWNANLDDDHSLERSDIKSVAGQYPAILGLDLGGIELLNEKNLDGNDFTRIREAAIAHHKRGGIVTLSSHMRNPVTGGSTWDTSDSTVVERILPGGSHHELYMTWLKNTADFIDTIRDENGNPIPMIFRPYHEHSATFFWWGWDLCSAEQYNSLWIMTHDYFVKERGLTNLVWAISPNGVEWFEQWTKRYPGDEYVDIVGLDFYYPTWIDGEANATPYYIQNTRLLFEYLAPFAKEHGKILAFTETGYEGIKNEHFWTEMLAPVLKNFPIAYVLTWRNASDEEKRDYHYYGTFPGEHSADDFNAFLKESNIWMINNIK